ncbi:MAG: glycoside hydrolase family 3 N-terminal domain-containing protein [Desulfosarcinaceae bacterium]|nr:glycoside hydrolase family 3 N-terminal domain-containing protein [Desulfosarcinaceae bacterium]
MGKVDPAAARLIGQRLMVGFDGTAWNDDIAFCIGQLRVGGLILFAANIETPAQVQALCADAQKCAADEGLPPLMIAVDQEGGPVARLRPPAFPHFMGAAEMAGLADADAFARLVADVLSPIGINMDMAPVLDLNVPSVESVMRTRAFGSDPETVTPMGVAVIDGLQQRGIMAVAKHFPGIGRTTLDSHLDRPDLDTDPDTLVRIDGAPFAAAIRAEVAACMLAHIRYTRIDPKWPASLSRRVVVDLLRRQMGYTGVTVTDDLDMGAIVRHYPDEMLLARIVHADVDIALICHSGPRRDQALGHLKRAIEKSSRTEEHKKSVQRILALKQRFLGEMAGDVPIRQ